jgi:hypothetical protein
LRLTSLELMPGAALVVAAVALAPDADLAAVADCRAVHHVDYESYQSSHRSLLSRRPTSASAGRRDCLRRAGGYLCRIGSLALGGGLLVLEVRPPFGLPRRRHLSGRGSKRLSRHERRSSHSPGGSLHDVRPDTIGILFLVCAVPFLPASVTHARYRWPDQSVFRAPPWFLDLRRAALFSCRWCAHP